MNDEKLQSWNQVKTIIWNEFLTLIIRIVKKLFDRAGNEAERIIDNWMPKPRIITT